MPEKLSIELRTEIFLLLSKHSVRQTSKLFNQLHPERLAPLRMATVSKIWDKLKATGSVHDRKKSGRPITSTIEGKAIGVLAKVRHNPHSLLSQEAGISMGSVSKILEQYKFHPYKMTILHELKESDYIKRIVFCREYLDMVEHIPMFPFKILSTDESIFTLKGIMNKQNYR